MNVWQQLLNYAVQILGAVAAVVIPYLISKYVKNKQLADALDAALERGVGLAEQAAANKLKANQPPITPQGKLEMAVQFTLDEMKQYGWDETAKEKLVTYIEAKLGSKKLGG